MKPVNMLKIVKHHLNEPIGFVPVVFQPNIESSHQVSRLGQSPPFLPVSMHKLKSIFVEVMPSRDDALTLLEFYMIKHHIAGYGGVQTLWLDECLAYVAHGQVAVPDPKAVQVRQVFRELHVLPWASCYDGYSWANTKLADRNYRIFRLTNEPDRRTIISHARQINIMRKL